MLWHPGPSSGLFEFLDACGGRLTRAPCSARPLLLCFDPDCSVTPTTAAMARNAAAPMVPSFFIGLRNEGLTVGIWRHLYKVVTIGAKTLHPRRHTGAQP